MVADRVGTLSVGVLLLAAGVGLVAGRHGAQSSPDIDRVKPGVVMIRTTLPEGKAFGAGFVIAVRPPDVYLMTANHLVRKGGDASSIDVQFASRPGEWHKATLLEMQDEESRELDVAVIRLDLPARVDPATLRRIPANQTSLTRGADVYPLGFPASNPWDSPVTPDKVARTSSRHVTFASQFVRPGSSGGPLLDGCGRIVGMVVNTDERLNAEAVRLDVLVDLAKRWLLNPLALEYSSGPCTTITEAPAPPPSAPDSGRGRGRGRGVLVPPASTSPVIYAVDMNDDLLWFGHDGHDDGSARWAAPTGKRVGNGWAFSHVFSGGEGRIYAIRPNGELLWFRHEGRADGSYRWALDDAKAVGSSWSVRQVFSGGDGVIYAVTTNGDLLWNRHEGRDDGTFRWAAPQGRKIGTGWIFGHVFSGGDGVIYAINSSNELLWFRHDGRADGSERWAAPAGKVVGTSWNVRQAFSGGDGIVYAINQKGDLLWNRHEGRDDGTFRWTAPEGRTVGSGWMFKQVFSGGGG